MRRWESISHTKSYNPYQRGAAKSDRLLEVANYPATHVTVEKIDHFLRIPICGFNGHDLPRLIDEPAPRRAAIADFNSREV